MDFGSQNPPKIDEKSIPKSSMFLDAFWTDFRKIFDNVGTLLDNFGNLQTRLFGPVAPPSQADWTFEIQVLRSIGERERN